MKLTIFASIVLTFLILPTTTVDTVNAAERDRMGTAGGDSTGLSIGSDPAEPGRAETLSPCEREDSAFEDSAFGAEPWPDAFACCGKPNPFPGLHCCDTQDCGWYKCDEDSVRMQDKMYYR